MRLAFWGTGKTAKEHLNHIRQLSKQFEIVAFIDGDCKRGEDGFSWEGYRLLAPESLSHLELDYLCILSVWEWEIRKKIYCEDLFDLSRIISLHEICMMDSFKQDLESCYGSLLKNIHPRQKASANMWRVYEDLKRKYSYILCDDSYYITDNVKKFDFEEGIRPIWILWLQGLGQAPELVKVCIQSVKRALTEKECICLLDETNLSKYIELPEYIIRKWQEGNITNTHFSDLIRLRLLNVYGGVWIDATVYFTGTELPDYIKTSRIFMFSIRESLESLTEPRIAANWLIAAEAGNKMLLLLETLLHEYWQQEDTSRNYYLFHIFLTIVAECFRDEWRQVEVILRDPAQLLNTELNCKFSKERFEYLKRISDVHKLSYKMPYKQGGEKSFWAKICEIERKADEKNCCYIGNI